MICLAVNIIIQVNFLKEIFMKKTLILSVITASSLLCAEINFNDASDRYTRINPTNGGDNVLSFHDSIANAKKSVVNISTTKTIRTNNQINPFNDPIFQEFFGFKFKMPQDSQKSTSLGSGVIISSDGYIVTNYHVVEDSDEIIVTLLDSSKEYKAKVIGTDSKTDIAIIKVNSSEFKAIKFADSSKILEGDVVFAIGNPFGVGGSISQGIISGLNKDNIGLNQYEDFIQTDASINPGNSGGALVDSRGALVGINSAILSRSGGNNGIGFAIPSNMVKQIAKKLIKDGKITRGYLGVMISNLTDDQKEIYSNKEGALVANVEKDGPAAIAGLKRGDLIIKVDDKDIKNANDLKNFIGSLDPNKEISVKFERSNEMNSVNLKLANMDSNGIAANETLELNGLKVQNLSENVRAKFKISKDVKGVVISEVKSGSNAEFAGFSVGDVIVQVNQRAISSVSDLQSEISASKKQQRKPMIWIDRGGMMMGLVLKLG